MDDGTAWTDLGGSLAITSLNQTDDASEISTALDRSGRPAVAWSNNSPGVRDIYLRRWDGKAWIEIAGSASGGGLSNSQTEYTGAPWVALDANDDPTVVWSQHFPAGRNDEIRLKRLQKVPSPDFRHP